MQQLIVATRPDWVIETGGGAGTTRFLTDVCELIGYGRVVPISEDSLGNAPRWLDGDIMVICDSDVYSEQHMLDEIRLYAPLVTEGCYLVVCHTDRSDWGAAPALARYLAERNEFEVTEPPAPTMNSYLRRI